MSITSIMGAALSGLQTAQTGLTTVSNNITNVNTPGYAREIVQQSPLVTGGVGDGVTVDDVQRVTNQYLESANYQATSAAGSSGIISTLLDQAQSAFGDPTQAGAYLNQLSTVFSDFSASANDPASSLPRTQTLDDLGAFFDTTDTVAGTLRSLDTQADGQITSDVSQINQLLTQISALNVQISKGTAEQANIAGSQDSQSQLLSQLSKLMTINVNTQADGSVVVRSSNGQLLAGNGQAASLTYTPSVSGLGVITATSAGTNRSTTLQIGDGELQGLLTLRNNTIPGIQQQLAGYVSGAVGAINAAHNANTAAPPPQTLTGRNTGLDLPTIAGDFTGKTNVAIVDANGNLTQQVAIDFSAGTMSVNGGAATAFTPATFLTSLNAALGGTGTASFSNGALSISATAAGSGVAIADDPTTPASDGGQGFSQFFGLNDLVTSSEITNYNTGLKATDANGFTPGGTITFQLANPAGTPTVTVTVAVPAAGAPTMQDLLNALNAPVGGMGQYGSFSLDANGAMTFTPTNPGSTLSVVSDNTQRGVNGPSMSQLFGLGVTQQASRATTFQIRPDISANPMNLALAKLNLSAAAGVPPQPVLAIGDGSGATALAQVANATTTFAAAGDMPAVTTSVNQYAARLGGDLGQKASAADTAKTAATAVQTEAQTRLQSVEGVNLDEELVNLTTFQQAYNASARLVQASKDMINTLLDIVP
ncbi:MAG TPA: flagellar hook-associated protein FlgK [Caulobacteraceae bacterium]|jgi:flagellar hook-associated protein 1 FlgK|nr:flagellar hook-associated protein FlgK [Caulobacteraceae bacterium]